MTDLLRDGLFQHAVQKTSLTRKLTIDGATEAYPVYRIKLDQLYYNDQNDRISTWISQYRAEGASALCENGNAQRRTYSAEIRQKALERVFSGGQGFFRRERRNSARSSE